MTLLDRGTWNASTWAPPPVLPAINVPLTVSFGVARPPVDEPRDAPEPCGIPPFTTARPIPRGDLDALLGNPQVAPEIVVRELGDRIGVPGWDGVSDVSFTRHPWFTSTGPDDATLHVPGARPVPGRPFPLFAGFLRACSSLRRERGTLTLRDERELAVRLVLSLSTLRETHE
ncbi:hypothetical protein KJ975_06935 [Myxococcota bacterium]|nr:hypothetical protein [Myxococcota bacterium]